MFIFGIYEDYDKSEKRRKQLEKLKEKTEKLKEKTKPTVVRIGLGIQKSDRRRKRRGSKIKFKVPRIRLIWVETMGAKCFLKPSAIQRKRLLLCKKLKEGENGKEKKNYQKKKKKID